MTRNDEMNTALKHVESLVKALGIKPLDIAYKKETKTSVLDFQEDIRRIHNIIPGQEYIYIWDAKTGILLKSINVTGDSTLYAVTDLMWYIARDF